jgi:type II secretory pathway component GspD/PulD (secretin)
MKTCVFIIVSAVLLAAHPLLAQNGDAPAPSEKSDAAPKAEAQTAPSEKPAANEDQPEAPKEPAPSIAKVDAPKKGEKNLRLNFRNVPLDMVLEYMSDAAGFIIVLDTEVKGKVDVWSNQPLSKEEAVDLLNTVLNQNGYAAIQNGRTLRIVSREDAKKRDIPVNQGNDPAAIPKTDKIVTQVIPIHYVNATQLTKDLEPLLPDYAKLTANESGNALVLTDTQSNIRRMAEIVRALDSFPGISKVRVFPLQYADAKELATAVKELFPAPATGNQNNNNRRFFGGGGGGGFPFGPGGGGGGQGGGGGGNAGGTPGAGATQNSRVVATADERSNSLVVSAPEDIMPTIEQLVNELDVATTDITELRVFHLNNADPVEMAEQFSELFPDDSKSTEQNQAGFRFGGGPFGFNRGGNRGAQTDNSTRNKKKGRVLAVADQRTSSLLVSAASELMPQIEQMVAQLDGNSGKKQHVYIYSLENADVQTVEQVVRDMFERTTTSQNRNNQNKTSILDTRTQQQQQNNNNSSAFRNGGFGGNSGGGASGAFR